jgi:hypothetical protein
VLRASAVAERLGIPTATLVGSGFAVQAENSVDGLGFERLPLAIFPGPHPNQQSYEELKNGVLNVTVDQVIEALTVDLAPAAQASGEPKPEDIVFTGSFEEVNEYWHRNKWSEGLPVMPPTIEAVRQFLKFTDRKPTEMLGTLLCDQREATLWNVAVNGVMAGCRPEYMPILLAIVEAIADPAFGIEHSGNTPGVESLVVLNGPIIKQLGFNSAQGVLRDGIRPNTSIGRFYRLYMRNVAGFILHETDKGTLGSSFRVILPENHDVLASLGWQPLAADLGFKADDNVVTVGGYTGSETVAHIAGTNAEQVMSYISEVTRWIAGNWHIVFTWHISVGTTRHLVVLSPLIAEIIANSGWDKARVRQYLFDHARIPAWQQEQILCHWMMGKHENNQLLNGVKEGRLPKVFAESEDPNRMVPIVCKPEDFMIAVAGAPGQKHAHVLAQNGFINYPTAKKIQLPAKWNELLSKAQGPKAG